MTSALSAGLMSLSRRCHNSTETPRRKAANPCGLVQPDAARQGDDSAVAATPRRTPTDRPERFWAASGAEGRRFESCRGHHCSCRSVLPFTFAQCAHAIRVLSLDCCAWQSRRVSANRRHSPSDLTLPSIGRRPRFPRMAGRVFALAACVIPPLWMLVAKLVWPGLIAQRIERPPPHRVGISPHSDYRTTS
jgi:hypothetical protein